MNKYFILSIICIILGILLLGLGISYGQGKVYWVVIIPIIEGTGVYSFFGILLIIAGIIFLMLSFVGSSFEIVGFDELEMKSSPKPYPTATTSKDDRNKRLKDYRTRDGRERSPRPEYRPEQRSERKTSVKTGGVVFIGPVPIIWGSDKKIAYIMALVSVVLVVVFLIFAVSMFI